jgi:hypothetical protein
MTGVSSALQRESLGLGDNAFGQLAIDRLCHPHGAVALVLREQLVVR